MKQKIEVKDILKGDKIRKEYIHPTNTAVDEAAIAYEFVARYTQDSWNGTAADYFLIEERPVVLPTEDGYYESGFYLTGTGCDAYQLNHGAWYMGREKLAESYMRSIMPLHKLGTEREIANKVLDEVLLECKSGYMTTKDNMEIVREKYNK